MLKIAPGVRFILASSSPRRRELLASCGINPEIIPSRCAEELRPGEAPDEMVLRLASEKAGEVAGRNPGAYVLGADTTVEVDGEILGKPADAGEAKRMLGRLQGRTHHVYSAFALVEKGRGMLHRECSQSVVEIARLSAEAIHAYVATGEPLDKAGAYGVQERGAFFVSRVEGSYTNVVGMNLSAVIDTLVRFKILLFTRD
jgi:septum formation protein